MSEGHEVGPDVDLDTEEVRDRQGRRVTEAYAEQAAAEALRLVRPGRPALGEVGRHSPRVSFRVPEQVRRQAEQRAVTEGRSVSEIARDALERYLRDAG
ncbi:ribbon-helix-helix protein, CopG family [Pseudonocardia endophytica]|uniref:Ribbon-helix-helix CopG family protein n=1 Tax=Pseudonocardia endophytica TaxID=401976 RepID=A0A4R1HWS1_PSEEN|nr:ribbon-helix-helix protein, CopG family [Pseudonocardia endophytica]TCK25220.1 ribbon-helix-helix CopG family protein [Pseudonocardia endophytica]